MQITKENIETLMLLYVDKELDVDTADALLLYLQQHPEHQVLLDAYMDTVLQPESNIIFEAKESLKKPVGNSVPFYAPKSKLRIASAAAVILLLGAGLLTFIFIRNHNQNDSVPITIQAQPQPRQLLPADTAKTHVKSAIPGPQPNTLAQKEHASGQAGSGVHSTPSNKTKPVPPSLQDDKNMIKDTIAIAHHLPEKTTVMLPGSVDSAPLPVVAKADHVTEADAPELAVNDASETSSSKGLLPGVVNMAGKIFNHKRKTTKLKINIGNNKEYILSFNY